MDDDLMSGMGGKTPDDADPSGPLASSPRARPALRLAKSSPSSVREEEKDISEDLEGDDGIDRRRKQRRSVLWPARLLVGRHDVACQIWNLSLGGARIRCDLPLRVGAPVALKIPGIEELSAHISWGEGDSMGLRFMDDEAQIKRHLKDRLSSLGLANE